MVYHHRQSSSRQMFLPLLIVALLAWGLPTTAYAEPGDSASQIFLPIVAMTEQVTASAACELNEWEKRIEALVKTHGEQQRPSMTCNPLLASVARARAEDMGRRAYFNHVNPDGQGPNYFARQAGYVLPASYSQELNGNNIESIGAGPDNADSMWNAWMASSKHTTHLLGKSSFFAEQVEYGIGVVQVPGSPYQYYWVFISARQGP